MNRHLWSLPAKLPVLDLGATGGGLRPVELTGGKQTVGLRFIGGDGLEYKFRPMVKDPPRSSRSATVSADSRRARRSDGRAVSYGGIVVARLLEAAGVVAPQPEAVVMPDDEQLGEFRAKFAGVVGMINIDPNERTDGSPGFGGFAEVLDDDEIDAELRGDPDATVDSRYLLRARMVDFLVGDWDRHLGQWRWGRVAGPGEPVWRAIPEDRDWAFSRMDGLVGIVSRFFVPRYTGFSERIPSPTAWRRPADHSTAAGWRPRPERIRGCCTGGAAPGDRFGDRLRPSPGFRGPPGCSSTTPPQWPARPAQPAGRVQPAIPDHVMRSIEVHTFDVTDDVFEFERRPDMRFRFLVRSGENPAIVRFDRLIDPHLTRTVSVYLNAGRDHVRGARHLPFTLRVIDVPPPDAAKKDPDKQVARAGS